ncbi:MAG: hypothetical protein ABJB03_12835 [Rhodoglobus sp.]
MTGNRIWLFGAVIATIAVIALGWLLGVSPKLTEAQSALDQKTGVDAQNAAQEAALVTLRDQFKHLKDLKKDLAVLQLEVPSSPDMDAFLDQVQATASAAGVVVSKVLAAEASNFAAAADGSVPAPTPDPSSTATPAPTDATTTVAPAANGAPTIAVAPSSALASKLFTVAITINVTGDFANLLNFEKAMQVGKRLFLATGFDFTNSATAGAGTGSITGYLFIVRDPAAFAAERAEAAAAASATPPPAPAATTAPAPTEEPSGEPTPDPTPGG